MPAPPAGLQISESTPPAPPPPTAPVADIPVISAPEQVPEAEPIPVVVAEPPVSKKKILPGRSSMGSLLKEVNDQIKVRTDTVEKAELNTETLPGLWQTFLEEIRDKAQPSFLSVAEAQVPKLREETIIFSVPNNISLEMLQLHKSEIATFFISRTTARVQLEFQMTRKDEPGRAFRSPKERLRDMVQANDAVNKLIQKFDLNLD